MLYNNEILPTLTVESSSRSINILLYKLLSLRRIEYLAVDRELKIKEISLKVQEFADIHEEIGEGKDVRDSFPELSGIEGILEGIIEEREQDFQLKSITRTLKDGSNLYLDLYIFGYKGQANADRLIILCEDVTESIAAQPSRVHPANENSIKVDYLAANGDYIDKIINSLGDVLLVTGTSGNIKKVNQAAQQLFGYTESELIGKSISMITTEEELLRKVSQLPPALKCEYWPQVKVACQTKIGLKVIVAFSCSTFETSIGSKDADSEVIQDFVYIGKDVTKQQHIKNSQEAQYAVTHILSESSSLDSATPRILQAICQSFGWDIGELWTPAEGEKETRFGAEIKSEKQPLLCLPLCCLIEETPCWRRVAVWQAAEEVSEFAENDPQITLAAGEGLPGAVSRSGSPEWITDIVGDRNFVRSRLAEQAGLRSGFGFPIQARGLVVGVMTFFCREELPPDKDLLQIIAVVSSQLGEFVKRKYAEQELQEAEASIRFLYEQEKRQSEELARQNLALEKAKLELEAANMELQRLASVDGLTQIPNRRCFDKKLELEWQWMEREKDSLSLILCDIDFFKLYNDHYGHQGGDECLKQVAEILARNAQRAGDLAARYGGEEFAIILSRTDVKGAMRVAESIRSDLKAAAIFHAASKVSKFITLSMGIATVVPAAGLSIQGLIGQADRALYGAKLQGRDRIVCLDLKREFQGGKGVFSDDCERS
ncbi:diguanylate cyclase [Microcoleus vaginatus GB1-A2]|uniref:diguanylate cyclase domain-containing protein n=1 Tax=Microcoleus vaginatus TaxID=119532 RepID=UPI00168231D9|nr:diguanylate cyclase [Microcoleus sp. FACHB-61]